jgi:hypothetical protein
MTKKLKKKKLKDKSEFMKKLKLVMQNQVCQVVCKKIMTENHNFHLKIYLSIILSSQKLEKWLQVKILKKCKENSKKSY